MESKIILLVDDSESEHMIVEFALEDCDQEIILHKAFDGQEALDMLKGMDTPPDLILLDINMPRMNGLEFLEEYSKHPSISTVVAMLTSSDNDSDKNTALSYECVSHYFLKPISDDSFDKVFELLE